LKGDKMKQATLDLIKNIDENTFIPPSTKNELFELFQLDTVADLRKVSRNFMKLYEILEHLDGQTSSATTEKAGIVKFGTETGNAIDAETWKQAIGQSLGGYVSKVESKEAGKWYINDLTDGKIYKCIQNHTSKSFDITKFVDITNVGLSDKVENLSNVETYVIDPRLTVGLIYKIGNICILILDTNEVYNGRSYGDVLFNIPEKFRPRFRTPVSVGIISSTSGGAAHIETNGNVVWRGARTSSALYINAVYLAK